MKLLSICLLFVSILFLNSCKKDNDQSGVNFNVNSTGRSLTISRLGGILNWTSGFASASEIEFEAENEDREVEYNSTANQRIDLFAPLSSLGFVNIPPGTYEEVEFEIQLTSSPAIPAFELRGTYNTTPIVFMINTPIEIEAEFEDVIIGSGADYTALISFNLSRLTQGITDAALSNATLTGGEIIISATSNINLYNFMLANLRECEEVEFDD
jgi:hypothetical protein